MGRFIGFVAAGASALVSLCAVPAAAQSCYGMQAELMELQAEGQGGFGDRSRYERAYREQANVLARTETRARNAGCFGTGFFLFRRQADPMCATLVPKLQDMQENLARLDELRHRGGSENALRIRELQGAMSARGCDLPSGTTFEASPQDDLLYDPDNPYFAGGTYRTLCVRTCDGYYFPISFSTTPDQFNTDARSCQAMCPGAEATLFYHPNPGGGPEDMISLSGVNYSALPTAFKYRTSLDPSCTCRPAGGYSVAVTTSSSSEDQQAVYADDPTAPLPRARPSPDEDPETLADRAGFFVPHLSSLAVAAGASLGTDGSGRPIRIVGPAIGNAAQDALVLTPVPN